MGKTYIGIGNTAKLVNKIYVGVNNVAHEVKKAYVGDANGIARKIFPSGADKLYLYNEGDECISVTGGWSGRKKKKNSDHFRMSTYQTTDTANFYTANNISYAGYSKLCIDGYISQGYNNYNSYIGYKSSSYSVSGVLGYYGNDKRTRGITTYSFSEYPYIMNNMHNKPIGVVIENDEEQPLNTTVIIYKIWLE